MGLKTQPPEGAITLSVSWHREFRTGTNVRLKLGGWKAKAHTRPILMQANLHQWWFKDKNTSRERQGALAQNPSGVITTTAILAVVLYSTLTLLSSYRHCRVQAHFKAFHGYKTPHFPFQTVTT